MEIHEIELLGEMADILEAEINQWNPDSYADPSEPNAERLLWVANNLRVLGIPEESAHQVSGAPVPSSAWSRHLAQTRGLAPIPIRGLSKSSCCQMPTVLIPKGQFVNSDCAGCGKSSFLRRWEFESLAQLLPVICPSCRIRMHADPSTYLYRFRCGRCWAVRYLADLLRRGQASS